MFAHILSSFAIFVSIRLLAYHDCDYSGHQESFHIGMLADIERTEMTVECLDREEDRGHEATTDESNIHETMVEETNDRAAIQEAAKYEAVIRDNESNDHTATAHGTMKRPSSASTPTAKPKGEAKPKAAAKAAANAGAMAEAGAASKAEAEAAAAAAAADVKAKAKGKSKVKPRAPTAGYFEAADTDAEEPAE